MNREAHRIRLARPEDIETLPEVERLAGLMFKSYQGDLGIPEEMYDQPNSVATFAAAQKAERLWVATAANGKPIGFALVVEIDGYAHLDELDVLPSYGRQGIGASLLTTVCRWATEAGYPGVTLRTFRDVPWNAPFYQRCGFRIVDSATVSKKHLALEALESQRGLQLDLRVTMLYTRSAVPRHLRRHDRFNGAVRRTR